MYEGVDGPHPLRFGKFTPSALALYLFPRKIQPLRKIAGLFHGEVAGNNLGNIFGCLLKCLVEQVLETGGAHRFREGIDPRGALMVVEFTDSQFNGAVAHGLHERMLAELALDIAQCGALNAARRMEHVLDATESQNAFREQIRAYLFTVGIMHRHANQVGDDGERLSVGFQDFLVWAERGNGFTLAGPEHHLIQIAFDDGVHF